MRLLGRAAGTVFALWLLLTLSTQSALACTGEVASLKTGIRGATSIYYARVVALSTLGTGFFDLQLDVGRVVRGQGLIHITKVISNEACTSIAVGDSGVVVLGSVNPFGGGPTDIYNFFYVIGPGRTTQAEARAVLSAAPATDSALLISDSSRTEPPQLPILIAALAGFIFAMGRFRRTTR